MNPLQYLQATRQVRSQLLSIIETALEQLEPEIVKAVQEQLAVGKRGDETYLKKYSPLTIKRKTEQNRIIMGERIALIDTGDFWNAMFLEVINGTFSIDSKDWKRDELVVRYGEEIFMLSDKQAEHIAGLAFPIIQEEVAKIYAQWN